ncbi:MAG: chorismate-binding protein [Pontiellaceae bacterium]|nr:chorismate-binding protein [Pontiellaceae bacterium]
MKVVLKHRGRWLHFSEPVKVLQTERVEEVLPMLHEAEASGLFCAGFISYEASSAFDSALKTRESEGFPLLCIGLFHTPKVLERIEKEPCATYDVGELTPSVSKAEFVDAIEQIRERIAEGATYQVNYTYRLDGTFAGDAWAFFCALVDGQKADYAAFVDTGGFAVCSASPELFFTLSGGQILSRPMKGTARRGRTFAEDVQLAEALKASQKDRAENIMIVDMIRNDIGRIAEPGSVETLSTYDVEKYPTVWQMTSTVQGKIYYEDTKITQDFPQGCPAALCSSYLRGGLVRIMKSLFPCASITGAPKAKTMEIIRSLETSPRKIYTGSIGFLTPQGEACFNVAIRTALIDRARGTLEYGVGGGIVWDSEADAEYEETLTKARILTQPRPEFQLLETMLWEPEHGIFLQNEHVQRLAKSAAYFDVPLELNAIQTALEQATADLDGPCRIRLLVSRDGAFEVQRFPMELGGDRLPNGPPTSRREVPIIKVALSPNPVDSHDVFLFHKTTHRTVYELAKAARPDCDDVILWNERGEVTESAIANVVIEKDGRLLTPPVECGLLGGTFREHLLKNGALEEGVVTRDDLRAADKIYLINSVRRWQQGILEE